LPSSGDPGDPFVLSACSVEQLSGSTIKPGGVPDMGFIEWVRGVFNPKTARRSGRNRRTKDEAEEEIEELVALDIV